MNIEETIIKRLKSLPDLAQREVLDFVEFLAYRREELPTREEDVAWSKFSLASAMRGMEDEETPYTLSDLKETFS